LMKIKAGSWISLHLLEIEYSRHPEVAICCTVYFSFW
jgi:hypothetical protein